MFGLKALTFKLAINLAVDLVNRYEDTVMDHLKVDPDLQRLIDAGTDVLGKLIGVRISQLKSQGKEEDVAGKQLKMFYNDMVIKSKEIAERDDLHPDLDKYRLPDPEKYMWQWNTDLGIWQRRKVK